MKILMLCDRESALTGNLQDGFQNLLADAGHDVTSVTLSREELKPCLGCFGCWVKTPGRCVAQNDGANCIAEKQMNSDAVLLLTKITYGGFSADIKSYLDRSIQNIASDFEVYKGEMRHKMRYKRFPAWVAVGYGDASEAERQTFAHLTQRNALNMRPDKFLSLTIKSDGTHEEAGRSILEFLEEGI
ncbi:MAG: NAD(P)H-dependent oxidoreductase [Clostridiales bacterium]|nr:NAD(P)H-dependent oxidoreductase [Clostridiales bacterium]